MLISVVIPCFNAENTIRATIDSALAQDADREIIVVDDGSLDGSRSIIESFGGAIRSEYGPNRGVSAARNRGGELARGDLLQFLDSDDLLAPDTLARRRDAIMSSGADAAYTDYQKLIEMPGQADIPGDVVQLPSHLLEQDAEAACADSRFWAPPAAIMYRRNLVERVGGWRTDFPVVEDARFLFDAAAEGARFTRVPGVGAYYRVRTQSLSRQNRRKFVHYCFINALGIEASWRARNVLTPSRAEVLQSLWRQCAIWSLMEASPDFEVARRNHNKIAQRRAALEAAWLLRRFCGAKAASSVARLRLQLRDYASRQDMSGTA